MYVCVHSFYVLWKSKLPLAEAATESCSWEKVSWKYAANLQDNTHAEEWFQRFEHFLEHL